jgi:hypothetical protein
MSWGEFKVSGTFFALVSECHSYLVPLIHLSSSGVVKEGPSDLARNHDHYLHGTPYREKGTGHL